MKKEFFISIVIMVLALFFAVSIHAQLPTTAPNGNNLMLGSNLGCWGEDNEPFVNSSDQQNDAGAVLGFMRFPCRSLSTGFVSEVCDAIRSQGMEPMPILSAASHPQDNVMYINALEGKAIYFEHGNENNYFDGWSGSQYADSWRTWVPQMRAANPNIKVGGPVGSHFDSNGSNYLREFLNAIKNEPELYPDFISMHVYAEHGEDVSDSEVISRAHSWGDGIDVMKADCQSILGVTLPFAITEWNWDAAPENSGDSRQNDATFQHNFNFAVLDEFKAHGVWGSCQYDFGAGAGGGKLDMYNKPQYDAIVAWNNANPPGPSNNPPTASITSPSEGATFNIGANITINANASDSDGNVTKVEFFQGSTKLGEDTSSPYSFTWNNVPEANYTLTAKATDNGGATATSAAVHITVGNPPEFPVDLQGTTPEEKAITLNVTKPDGVTDATLEMLVYDPDYPDEGALYINGDVNSITLFGSQGTSGNDGATVTVNYNTPAAWWNDGSNSLRFTHTSTGGYRVESASVTFSGEPPPEGFPVDLQDSTPEEKTVSLNVVKPAGVTDATLFMVVYDPDQANEGTLYINGDVNTITLFGSQGTSANDATTVTVTYDTPASWWNDGANSLRFTHTSTAGYRVESASVSFIVSNQPPTVNITSPSDGAPFNEGDDITINANASDSDGNITLVEFFQGSTKLGEDTSSPYSYTWNNVSAGNYALTAKATDNDGATTTSFAVNITVNAPPPTSFSVEAETMSLTNYIVNTNSSASNGNLIKLSASGVTGSATYNFTGSSGTYDIQVWYWDENDGACTFRIYVGGNQVDSWTANQNLGSADPVAQTRSSRTKTGVSISYGAQIKLEAVQNSQEWGRWDLVEFTLVGAPGNQPPAVNITSPSDGATFTEGDNITINANASDADGSVTLVEFFQGSTKLGEDASSPYSYTWSSVAAGSYSLTAKATDNEGAATTSSAVNITVNPPANQPPTVSITSPADGATFTAPANITINANASDSDGSVTLVEFFQGSTKLGEDTSSPYSYTWNSVAAGSYSLTAKATDNGGATTTSSAVNITVTGSGGGGSYEAESGTVAGGATVTSSSAASGGAYVGNLHIVSSSVTVSGVDGGSGGSFPLTIQYATNDANPSLDLYVNNNLVNTITFANTGGWETFTTTSTNVTFNAGTGNTIKFQHNSGNSGGTNIDVLTVGTAPSTITKEAESMTLTNYVVNSNSSASGGSLIKLSASGVTGNATFNFTGTTGSYNIKVYYYDENDGACTFRIYVGGTMVDEWVANQNLGSADPVAQTRTSRTKTGVSIANGAQIKLEAVQNSQEWGRYDLVEITTSLSKPMVQAEAEKSQPTGFSLDQNYPNPFNPETSISYQLPEASKVQLEIYDIRGSMVRVLVNSEQSAGFHTVRWNGLNESGQKVANGMYIYRFKATGANGVFIQYKKMLLLK